MLPWGTPLRVCFADETLFLTFTLYTRFCKYDDNSLRKPWSSQNWKAIAEGYQ